MTDHFLEKAFEGHEVRAILDSQGQPWFVAKDACEILEIENPRDAVADFREKPELKGVGTIYPLERMEVNIPTAGGEQMRGFCIQHKAPPMRLTYPSSLDHLNLYFPYLQPRRNGYGSSAFKLCHRKTNAQGLHLGQVCQVLDRRSS